MSDEADRAVDLAQPLLDADIANHHNRALADNVPFIEGDCEVCGNDSKRLVQCNHPKDGPVWACARCRDTNKLPVRRVI